MFAQAMTDLMNHSGYQVGGCVATVAEARDVMVESARSGEIIDLVICDLSLPDGNGARVCRTAAELHPSTCVVVVSGSCAEEDVSAALLAGASGFITKHCDPVEMLGMIRKAVEGDTVLDPRTAAMVAAAIRRLGSPNLTTREIEVLELYDKGFSTKQIGEQLYLSGATVKTHAARAGNKLGCGERQATLAAARTLGLLASSTCR